MRILLIEDKKESAEFIRRALVENHYQVDLVSSVKEALLQIEVHSYNLVISRVILGGKSGLDLCRELRRNKNSLPVLLLSAKKKVKDKVEGLNLGADDYLTKPFEVEELLARVRALLRRAQYNRGAVLKVADLSLDQAKQKVTRAKKEISLTSREYALLRYLIVRADEVVTRTSISEHVWGDSSILLTNIIDVYINRIRKKIDNNFDPPLIQTIRFSGYTIKG